jgi:hypothetical protein
VKVYNVLCKHLEELLEKPLPLEQFRGLITGSTVTEEPFVSVIMDEFSRFAYEILLCAHSRAVGRIDFDRQWRSSGVNVVAASALRGDQETLLMAEAGSRIRTEKGEWEVTWQGLACR